MNGTLLQFDFFGIFSNLTAFLVLFILLGGAAGAVSRKLSITVFGALLVFTHVVIETDLFIFDAILYLMLIIIILYGANYAVESYFSESGEVA